MTDQDRKPTTGPAAQRMIDAMAYAHVDPSPYAREPNFHYPPDAVLLEITPTMVGRIVEVHLPKSQTVGRIVAYYVSSEGVYHVQFETTVSHEDGDVMHLAPNTFVVVMVG